VKYVSVSQSVSIGLLTCQTHVCTYTNPELKQ